MAIWVGKQKMSCRSCIKGHRSSTCNHIGGPLWAVRPAGRPNKACVHGPGDLCLCAHFFPLTWLKAAVPRKQKCPCGSSAHSHHNSSHHNSSSNNNSISSTSSAKKCQCASASAKSTAATTPEDETQPVFYQDLVARGLHVTSEPVELDVISPPAAGSCCSAPGPAPAMVVAAPLPAPAPAPAPAQAAAAAAAGGGGGGGGYCCCSNKQAGSVSPVQLPMAVAVPAPPVAAPSSCCAGPAKMESSVASPPATGNGYSTPHRHHHHHHQGQSHVKSEPISHPFTPVQQFPTPPDFPVLRFSPLQHASTVDHVCKCGPTCNCVLCIDHPYNSATMNHIATEFGHMMSSHVQFSPLVGNGHVTGHMTGSRPDILPPGWPKHAAIAGAGFGESPFLHPQQSFSPPPQASDMDIILNPADFEMFNYAFPPTDDNGQHQHQHQQQNINNNNNNNNNNPNPLHLDTSMHMNLDGMPELLDIDGFCEGAPAGCPCGDDCACIGCQIHKPTATNGFDQGLGLGLGIGDSTAPPEWG
ncbi:hypothetical protein BD289DRAFT_94605 [Coniella lustricola]|uniref:Copper-fist domain-containing protein n=1 Tax=Coniella lustricola TaxID=2025994 RepID=A0A2T2ZYA5_9PEZI|nr:hypothetical protein BD289DRAFT_94605 [Coniella lustricola]